jgi:hypothetical protein
LAAPSRRSTSAANVAPPTTTHGRRQTGTRRQHRLASNESGRSPTSRRHARHPATRCACRRIGASPNLAWREILFMTVLLVWSRDTLVKDF